MTVYLYTLLEPYTYEHQFLKGVEFSNQWIEISEGKLTVHANYSWDGCTPKWQPLGLFTIGVPDGALRNGKPWLYYESLIHDVLCQFRDCLPFTQQQVTQIFKEDLQRAKWPLCQLYTAGVNYLGPQDFKA